MMRKNLLEEKFFYLYHMNLKPEDSMSLPIIERQWYIQRFVEQKNKENEQMAAAQQKAKRRH